MIGLLHPEQVGRLPSVKCWLQNAVSVLTDVPAVDPMEDRSSILEEIIEANVVVQLGHLRTHPSVAKGIARGALGLSGWVYDIGRGTVRVYNAEEGAFVPVICDRQTATGATIA